VHGLLHIADGIAAAGPVWATWAFVMERYCGFVKRRAVRSRSHPYASINRRILEMAQLNVILMKYGLRKKLTLKARRDKVKKDKFPECKSYSAPSHRAVAEMLWVDPHYTLLAPRKKLKINEGLRRQLADLIITRCSPDFGIRKIPNAVARKYVPDQLKEWGRVQLADGGDRIKAHALVDKDTPIRRTCCFVRVSTFVLAYKCS
jgi:hypothetical protein